LRRPFPRKVSLGLQLGLAKKKISIDRPNKKMFLVVRYGYVTAIVVLTINCPPFLNFDAIKNQALFMQKEKN
jgi:hypothetical protein